MTQSNLVDRAKQGDPQAIATLMNRSLQPKGILARVSREGDRLRIYLEAEQVPNREALMTFVQNGVSNLRIDNISVVEVIGQQIGQDEAVWTQEWQLDPAEAETGIEFVSRGNPEVVVLQRNQPPVPPPRPIPPPAPPRPLAFSEPAVEAELDDSDLDDDELSTIREGLSGLAYAPLESEPLPATPTNNIYGLGAIDLGGEPEEDELPPELLAAEVARQVQQDIPPDLLVDEDTAIPLTAADRPDLTDIDLTDEAIGLAQFPSVNDLALSNGLYTEDDLFLEDSDLSLEDSDLSLEDSDLSLEDSDLFLEDSNLALEDSELTLENNELVLEDEPFNVEEPRLEESEFDPNVFLEDDYPDLETDELPPPPPPPPQMEITASPDMNAGDDLQITYLDEDEDEDENFIVTEIEPESSFGQEDVLFSSDEEAPQGQMIGSPIAIQPVHPPEGEGEDESQRSGVSLWVWLVAFFLIGWIGALIGLSIWSDRPDTPPNPQPQAGPVRSV